MFKFIGVGGRAVGQGGGTRLLSEREVWEHWEEVCGKRGMVYWQQKMFRVWAIVTKRGVGGDLQLLKHTIKTYLLF